MRKFALKAIFTFLTLDRTERKRVNWDRIILIFSTGRTVYLWKVDLALVALP
jgi:hypothetical protein